MPNNCKLHKQRKEATDHEKKLNAVWCRTAEAEEISKRDYWMIKNEIAEREKNTADIIGGRAFYCSNQEEYCNPKLQSGSRSRKYHHNPTFTQP